MTAGGSTLNQFTIEISLKSILTAWHAFEMPRFYFDLFVKSTSRSISTYIKTLSAVFILTYLLRDKYPQSTSLEEKEDVFEVRDPTCFV